MIQRKHRFHGLRSLGFVMRRGDLVHTQSVALKYALNPQQSHYRAGVVVSRKVNKSAVVRNRIRRRLYEAVRQAETGITKPYDLVFLVRDDSLKDLPAQQLVKRLRTLLAKANVVAREESAASSNHDIVIQKETPKHNVHDADRPADL